MIILAIKMSLIFTNSIKITRKKKRQKEWKERKMYEVNSFKLKTNRLAFEQFNNRYICKSHKRQLLKIINKFNKISQLTPHLKGTTLGGVQYIM